MPMENIVSYFGSSNKRSRDLTFCFLRAGQYYTVVGTVPISVDICFVGHASEQSTDSRRFASWLYFFSLAVLGVPLVQL